MTLADLLAPGAEPVNSLDDADSPETRQQFIDRMKAEGFRVVEPEDDELQIDIDSPEQYRQFLACWTTFHRVITARYGDEPTCVEAGSRSKLPGRRHVTVKLPFEIHDPQERIMWQACLGSDPMRELLSALRSDRGDIKPTLFVENQ